MTKARKAPASRSRPSATAQLGPEKQALNHRRTRQAHAAEIAEDYVEVIADLIDAGGEARAVDIAKRLGVTHVTVTKTVARLQKGGLVKSRPYRSIFLTEAGRRLADASRQRHQTVTRFLTAIGVSEPIAHSDAEGIEHHVSEETLRAMRAFVASR
jgi:DtxR family transcriptional regulator, manganese transport regulator